MIKKMLFFLTLGILVFSCKNSKNSNSFSFETGEFKTYLENKRDSSFFIRKGNLQIETYKNQKDTFEIEWKSKFEYHLKKINPKSKLDSTPFITKITKIKNDSYEFQANYMGSNFKQKGSTFKIDN